MTTARVHSHRTLALVDRLQRLLAERQELVMQEERDYLSPPLPREGRSKARLAELQVEVAEVLDSLATLIPPEFPGRFSHPASAAGERD